MQDDGLGPESPLTRAATVTRRAFGQALGMAAVAGTVPGLSGTASAQPAKVAIAAGAGDELCDLSAIELVARMRRKQVSAREVMTAHLARIERVNTKVNAVVTLVAERAMADATLADERMARGEATGVCTACRWRTRGLWSIRPASVRPAAARFTATTCRPGTR